METILLVDDEPGVLRLCYQILNLDGYRVLQATSGEEALRLLQKNSEGLDLALLDVIMPGMAGDELVEPGGLSEERTSRGASSQSAA